MSKQHLAVMVVIGGSGGGYYWLPLSPWQRQTEAEAEAVCGGGRHVSVPVADVEHVTPRRGRVCATVLM